MVMTGLLFMHDLRFRNISRLIERTDRFSKHRKGTGGRQGTQAVEKDILHGGFTPRNKGLMPLVAETV